MEHHPTTQVLLFWSFLLWPQRICYSETNCLENNLVFSIVPVTFKKKKVLNSSHSSAAVNLILVPVFLTGVPLRNAASVSANWHIRKRKRWLVNGFAADLVEYRERILGDQDWKDNERQKRGTETDAQQHDETPQSTCWQKTNQPNKWQNSTVSTKLFSILLKTCMRNWHSLGWYCSLHVCSGWGPSWKQKGKAVLVNRPLNTGQLAM